MNHGGLVNALGFTRLYARMTLAALLAVGATLLGAAPGAEAKPRCFGKPATKVGTNGADRLTGSPRKDVIVALGGDDVVQAKSNDDRVCLGNGDDFAGTSRGFDKIEGGDGNDEMHGGGFSGRRDPGDGDLILGRRWERLPRRHPGRAQGQGQGRPR